MNMSILPNMTAQEIWTEVVPRAHIATGVFIIVAGD